MKLKYLGTGAFEGIPSVMFTCELCQKARRLKGRYIRTRHQALLNDDLLLDFGPDTYMHLLKYDINLLDIHDILITHKHRDHFCPDELLLMIPKFSVNKRAHDLQLYGAEVVVKQVKDVVGDKLDFLKPVSVDLYKPFEAGRYEVTPLEANHGDDGLGGYYIYGIKEDKKNMLYAYDTNTLKDSVWEYFVEKKPYYDLVALDCTRGHEDLHYIYHMNLDKCTETKRRMIELGVADEHTKFVLSHFSHNGGHIDYDEFCEIAGERGFIVAYDGLEIIF